MRCPSEESLPTELCEGPVPDHELDTRSPTQAAQHERGETRMEVSDRVELIERIKRGESPTWVPSKTLEGYFQETHDPPLRRSPDVLPPRSSPLLPAAELKQLWKSSRPSEDENLSPPEEIQRPRSALHSGDFTQEQSPRPDRDEISFAPAGGLAQSQPGVFSSSPPAPWQFCSSHPAISPFQTDSRFSTGYYKAAEIASGRSRGPSLSSYSSSFVLKAPTTPLVQASNNNDLEFSPETSPLEIYDPSIKSPRCNTLPRYRLSSSQSSPPGQLPLAHQPRRYPPSGRRETTLPYQAHQPRRSLSSFHSLQLSSSPQTPPLLRSRRPSMSSEISPLQHASMVGSYEESILRGRMSTTPSKPLNFMAQIGVLGKGRCRPNLRCPAHVSIPFPAVFYSYGKSNVGRSTSSDDNPSPYVGLIDLENTLSKSDERDDDQRHRRPQTRPPCCSRSHGLDDMEADPKPVPQLSDAELRKREKRKRRSTSPRIPPGGSYRIPEKGQLQIVIKNPNKTAVKLFLVPYDLEGMEAGTKTFIRQRSYSTGPVIDIPPGFRTDMNENERSSKERPTLRYLIHLHICCPSKGRYYLYKSIRVVFANRVPDGKESLKNEIQLPEPRYSVYKPNRDSAAFSTSSVGSNMTADRTAFRRRSSGFALPSSQGFDSIDGIGESGPINPFPNFVSRPSQPTPFIPFGASRISQALVDPNINTENMDVDEQSSTNGSTTNYSSASPAPRDSRMSSPGSVGGVYEKLRKGEIGYGGKSLGSSGDGSEVGHGLLARRLKGLDVQQATERRDLTES